MKLEINSHQLKRAAIKLLIKLLDINIYASDFLLAAKDLDDSSRPSMYLNVSTLFGCTCITVGKQSPWYLSFVYMSLVSLTVRTALTFENIWDPCGNLFCFYLFSNTYTIIYRIKSPLFSINYFQSAFSDC